MAWEQESLLALRSVIATVLGALVGWQRQRWGQEAGIRTFAAVALGACVFGLIAPGGDTRVAAQIASGIGFLGAGVIIHGRQHVHGLTTAASLWATASIGTEIAYQHYLLGTTVTIILIVLLTIPTKGKEANKLLTKPAQRLPDVNQPMTRE